MTKGKTADIVICAVMAALIAVMSQIAIPSPAGVPFTLQTFAAALCGYCLSSKRACVTVGVYILIGAVGVPVFSGFKGGIGVLFSLTGGFIFGLAALAALCGIERKKSLLSLVFSAVGLLCCHIIGTLQFSIVTSSDVLQSFAVVSLPFVLKDIISVWAAFCVSRPIMRAVGATGSQ